MHLHHRRPGKTRKGRTIPLSRADAYAVINQERRYQDSTYSPDEETVPGQTRRQRDIGVTPHILLLEEYVAKARAAWVNRKGDDLPALQQIAKVAAIAVRALERASGSEKLLEKGLR